MATEETQDGQEAPKKKRALAVALAVALGLLAGGGAGAFAAASLLPKPAAVAGAAEKDAEAAAEEHGSEGEEAEGHGEDAGAATYLMENVVMNPAGTGGTRFLIVSVAFGVRDAEVAEEMKVRDHEVRDALVGVLGSKTVAQLAEVAARDSLKTELRTRVAGLFPGGAVKQVFFPQFVIQ